jgi:5-formyltetrahydrofolate cyclo-ligase
VRASGIVRSSPRWKQAGLVLAFLSMPTEIDTGPVIEAALAAYKRVAVPRIEGGDIAFVELTPDWRSWPRDRWDIPAPPDSLAPLSAVGIAAAPTLALVPGLAFDGSGGRLGRGKGYYDRFLASVAAAREPMGKSAPPFAAIGFGYESQLVERVPMDDRDRPLDGLALG